jgi:hypothetical protein
LQPWHEFRRIERLVGPKRQRLHLLIMVVLEAVALAVAVIMIVVMVIVAVIMIVLMLAAGFQKIRLKVEDTVEIERAALKHVC